MTLPLPCLFRSRRSGSLSRGSAAQSQQLIQMVLDTSDTHLEALVLLALVKRDCGERTEAHGIALRVLELEPSEPYCSRIIESSMS